jgi:hypothetical protein
MKTNYRLGDTVRDETAHAINGVEGRRFAVIAGAAPGTMANQKWLASKEYREGGKRYRITAEIRFDDECRNGHNSFSITGSVDEWTGSGWRDYMGGCIHDEIAKRFPQLAPLIKWHLSSTDGPLHYLSNTVYHAGDRDCHGLRKGESRQIRNGKTGKLAWRLEQPGEAAKYIDADTCPPAPPAAHYVPWMREGEGKARELDHARASAVWPDATDQELMQEPDALRAALTARLPALLVEFRAAIEGAGLLWQLPHDAGQA